MSRELCSRSDKQIFMPSEAAVIAALLLPKFTSEQCVHHDCCRFDDMPSHD